MKRLHFIAFATVALLVVAACGGGTGPDADADNPAKIDVVVTAATELIVIPWLVGQDQGFFEDHGVKVDKIVAAKSGNTSLRTQLAGNVPIGDMSFSSAIEAKDAGTPISIVGGATQGAGFYGFYALADNDAIKDIGDIKTWSYSSPGTATEALTYVLPKLAGIEGQGVKRVAAGGLGEGIALLEAGDVDVAMIPPSAIYKMADKFKLIASDSDYLKSFQITVLTTTAEYAKSHPAVVEGVVAGYGEAAAWIAKNPAEAAKLYGTYNDIPIAAAEKIVKEGLVANAWGAGFNSEAITNASDIMKAARFKGKFDYCATFDDSFLPEGASKSLPEPCK